MKTKKVQCCKETIYGLTFGMVYNVISEDAMFFRIVDDNGNTVAVGKDKFLVYYRSRSPLATYTTISGRKIKVAENRSKRTFTIVTDAARYRTFPMSNDEFESNRHNTGQDWQQFLNGSDYYKI